ncbi:glycosyl hydrolase [Paludibaculum fermentans]|uniref:glycosyl hydrolase n=1 Tax=Paludibaculum fermentans TaxID=1473598 RepID=UPI003EB97B3A
MRSNILVPSFCIFLAPLAAIGQTPAKPPSAPTTDALQRDFLTPPSTARPRVWWHWMNGNISREGIQLDLSWMKRVGIGGLQNFDAALATPQVVDKRLAYMTPEWKDAFRYAAGLADELGLEMAIASSPGWSETGGPWVKPEQAMKKLVWSETRITGGQPFRGTLPKPPTITGPFQSVPYRDDLPLPGVEKTPPQYFRDAAVVAYPLPRAAADSEPASVTSSTGPVDATLLTDGDLTRGISIPTGGDSAGGWLRFEFPAPRTIHAITLARPMVGMFMPAPPVKLQFEASEDGQNYHKVADLPSTRVAQQTVSFPAVTARYFRLSTRPAPPASLLDAFEPAPGADTGFFGAMAAAAKPVVQINECRLHPTPRINRFEEKAGFGLVLDYYAIASPPFKAEETLRPADVVDLTSRMKPDGSLDWTPPAGEWMVLRLGYSLTGTLNHPATAEATGLEVDKLDQNAVKQYIETYLGTYAETLGPQLMGRRGVKALLTDSIEVGAYNWTADMLAQFKRLRGYDPTPFLPALTGVVIGSAEQSDNFLWDFRRTLAQLTAQSHYGQIARSARERGLTYYGESLEGTRVSIGDDMEMRQNADIPMSAMWTYSPARGPRSNYVIDIRGAASVAHIYGQNLVAAESMTSAMVPWGFSPRILKPIIDLEFALGVNRPVIHTSVHQPLVGKKPGLALMIFGQYFNRNETWAEQAGPWVSYLSRNAHMLQQGKFAADVAYFYGEEAPLAGLYGEGSTLPKDLPTGYGFDFANSDVVLNKLTVANGGLETASGMHYRLLYLGGSSNRMTLPVLRKLRDLVTAGAVVVGDRPTSSPSLADNASEFTAVADALWGANPTAPSAEKNLGKGKVIFGHDVNRALASLSVPRDFDYTKPEPGSEVMFLHRRLADGDLYFLSNRLDRRQSLEATFRVSGKRPELWHAEDGRIEPVSYRIENGRTTLPLRLEGNESVFVVFRRPAVTQRLTVPAQAQTKLATLEGAWELHFAPNLGAPPQATLNHLASWSENPEPGVKYFSGTAAYRKSFDAPAGWLKQGGRLTLDLGDVRELAEVSLNGRPLGIVWHPPYRIDITSALKPGPNNLEVKVTNLWVNRLIGDQQPGAAKVSFTVPPTYKPDAPLLPSGLLGPVVIEQSVAAQP